MRVLLVQLVLGVMILVGIASVVLISLAIVNLYGHQRATDKQLCVVVQAEWQQIKRLGAEAGLQMPPDPPPCLPPR